MLCAAIVATMAESFLGRAATGWYRARNRLTVAAQTAHADGLVRESQGRAVSRDVEYVDTEGNRDC